MALDVTVADGTDGINTTITDADSGVAVDVTGDSAVHATVVSGGSSGGSSGGGSSWAQQTVTSDTTASDDDSIWANAATQSVTVTLPAAAQSAHVRVVAVDTANGVTVTGDGTEQIADHTGMAQTITMTQGESITLESDGSIWWMV